MADPVDANTAKTIEPPHSWEIHIKKRQFILRSQLHRIPEKFIDVDIQPKSGITLSTKRFSRKYHVVIPFPKTITVGDPQDAESLLDRRGILTVRIPLKRISTSLIKEREEGLNSQKTLEKPGESIKMRTKDIFFEPKAKKMPDQKESSPEEILKPGSEQPEKRKKRSHEKASLVSDNDMLALSKEYSSKAAKKVAELENKQKELQQQHQKAIEKRQIRKEKKSDLVLQAFNRVIEEKKVNLKRMIGQANKN